jgi:protein-tyrosine phosphatase
LTDGHDRVEPYRHLLDSRVRHACFPIRDGCYPSAGQMESILRTIDDEVAHGGTVYVHCVGGCGRTGTVVSCWLVRHGIPPDVALARYSAASFCVTEGRCPETSGQRAMVLGWQAAPEARVRAP